MSGIDEEFEAGRSPVRGIALGVVSGIALWLIAGGLWVSLRASL